MLSGQSVLITAGPTWEALDPVRGLTNLSSGKMGYAMAEQAVVMGAKTTLVSGPTCLACPPEVTRIDVQSAQEMYAAVHQRVADSDVFIAVAAVADYRPVNQAAQKIKKNADEITLTLVKNPDILASVGQLETHRPYTVGFAAETENVLGYARGKLEKKRLDMICANDVSQTGLGFGSDRNQIYLLTPNHTLDLGLARKTDLATLILNEIAARLPS